LTRIPLARPVLIEFFSCHFRGACSFWVLIVRQKKPAHAHFNRKTHTHAKGMKDKDGLLVRAMLPVLFVTAALV